MSTGVFRENIDYIVKVPLTDGQKLAAAEEMAEAWADKVNLEAKKKIAADGFKELIEGEEARIKRNGNLLRKGHIETEMECERIKDYGLNTVTIFRLDTGEPVSSRELNDDEQQMDMPTEEEPKDEFPDPPGGGYPPGSDLFKGPPDTSATDEGLSDVDTSEMDGDPETPDPLDDGPPE